MGENKVFFVFDYVFAFMLIPYNMIFYFYLPYFHVSNNALFLHSTLVLSFDIDVVLTLSNKTSSTTDMNDFEISVSYSSNTGKFCYSSVYI